jgi:malic enzyme
MLAHLLVRYQNDLLTFNDDVQGTAAVALGAVIGASKVAGKKIKDHRIVFVGAGSAAIGVADYLRIAIGRRRTFRKGGPRSFLDCRQRWLIGQRSARPF